MSDLIAVLDDALASYGEDVTLRRVIGSGSNVANVDVVCRARVDAATTEQIAAGIAASDFNLILSTTPLLEKGWPDGDPANIVPEENGRDKVIIRSQPPRTVVFADPKVVDNVVVRINLRGSG